MRYYFNGASDELKEVTEGLTAPTPPQVTEAINKAKEAKDKANFIEKLSLRLKESIKAKKLSNK